MNRYRANKACWVIAHGAGPASLFALVPGQEVVTAQPTTEVFYRQADALAKMRYLNPAYSPPSATDKRFSGAHDGRHEPLSRDHEPTP